MRNVSDKTCRENRNTVLGSIQFSENLSVYRLMWKNMVEPGRQRWKCVYRGADKSLARPTSLCILFDCENISFDANLVIYTNSTNIPPIMLINRIYEGWNFNSGNYLFTTDTK